MSIAIYVLCAATSLSCAALLFRAYRRSNARLLLWSAVFFAGMFLHNLLLVIDLRVVPNVDLSVWRSLPALAGVIALLYGLDLGQPRMSTTPLELTAMITGALTIGYAVAGTFFLKYWRESRDRLFLLFGLALWVLAFQRLALGLTTRINEDAPVLYGIRLLAFLLILYAIIDKNRQA